MENGEWIGGIGINGFGTSGSDDETDSTTDIEPSGSSGDEKSLKSKSKSNMRVARRQSLNSKGSGHRQSSLDSTKKTKATNTSGNRSKNRKVSLDTGSNGHKLTGSSSVSSFEEIDPNESDI